ncbi:hypothetical protein B0H34DRAFT_672869 [Crassisporium funariophilum]|nr:hypothetical protein B0H34DRAFT_672869 [Crassisporium funariophilum]
MRTFAHIVVPALALVNGMGVYAAAITDTAGSQLAGAGAGVLPREQSLYASRQIHNADFSPSNVPGTTTPAAPAAPAQAIQTAKKISKRATFSGFVIKSLIGGLIKRAGLPSAPVPPTNGLPVAAPAAPAAPAPPAPPAPVADALASAQGLAARHDVGKTLTNTFEQRDGPPVPDIDNTAAGYPIGNFISGRAMEVTAVGTGVPVVSSKIRRWVKREDDLTFPDDDSDSEPQFDQSEYLV